MPRTGRPPAVFGLFGDAQWTYNALIVEVESDAKPGRALVRFRDLPGVNGLIFAES